MDYCDTCGQPLPENTDRQNYAYTIKNNKKVYLSFVECKQKVKKNKEKEKTKVKKTL